MRGRRGAVSLSTMVMVAGVFAVLDVAPVRAVAPPAPLVVLTGVNSLARLDASAPASIGAMVAVSGLQAGEVLVGIDVRPATGELIGIGIVGTAGRVYRIDVATGSATAIGAGPFSTTLPAGGRWSVDFNPVVDRLRVIHSGGTNLRVNASTGALVATDTPTSGGSVLAAAYDRNLASTTATTLFAINDTTDALATVGGANGTPSPNGGVVSAVGPLGVVIDAATGAGLDIAPAAAGPGTAYAVLRVAGTYRIHTVDLATGAATDHGALGVDATGGILDVAVLPVLPAGASEFTPVTPTRLLDTRDGTGAPASKPGPAGVVDLQVTGGVVPAGATAVVLNVVGTEATADGFLTVYPTGETLPLAANQNLVAGQTRGNLVTVKVGAGGRVSIFTQSGTHLVADVFGYYSLPTTTAGRFTALAPTRLHDTRTTAKLLPGTSVDIQVTGNAGVPTTGVSSVVVNITATEATAAGFVTGHATGTTRPNTANLNVERPNQTIGNLAILPVSAAGSITLFSQSGTHLVVDIAGWFSDATSRGGYSGLFVPDTPTRILDTRTPPLMKLPAGAIVDIVLTPAGAVIPPTAIVVNLTAVEVTAPGFLTMYPTGSPRPVVSSLYGDTAGQIIPSLAYATLAPGGRVTIFSNAGTHVVVDLAGYYTS